MRKSRRRGQHAAKTVLRLPDLEHAKSAVLNSLPSPESRRSYVFAIRNFVYWYCSEPRLALNRLVVTRYRMGLEQLRLAPSTINRRLAAVRRLAYEAADAGLLSPELAAGARVFVTLQVASSNRSNSFSGMYRCRRQSVIVGASRRSRMP
jgi:hypothetical protein